MYRFIYNYNRSEWSPAKLWGYGGWYRGIGEGDGGVSMARDREEGMKGKRIEIYIVLYNLKVALICALKDYCSIYF